MPVAASSVRAVLTWTAGPGIPDVDVSALLLTEQGRVRSDDDFVFYNQPRHASGAVSHGGKSASGSVTTDVIRVDLGAMEAAISSVLIAASADGGSFGDVPGLLLAVHVQVWPWPCTTTAVRGSLSSRSPTPQRKPPSCSASCTGGPVGGSSGPSGRDTLRGSAALPPTSESASLTNRSGRRQSPNRPHPGPRSPPKPRSSRLPGRPGHRNRSPPKPWSSRLPGRPGHRNRRRRR